ncbi:hypothetical protein SAMN05444008_10643 [Cnuella takakiae]|uniref:Dolichyl-phosphate-mannose-protein mannosyltransferase n=1 Tax=Cnuella takakiae TaxID=1302690 RepID=A0A1M4ZZL2_9BACT|nr:hypothetical protein [Cnuella takakiae]OLY92160.1 hypothetical protein BUE76_09825 [Cnuella takakiae]SHF23076.1 hypothetical protein SAMN05444008_10643 [Cnuella takakiae]
MQQELTQKSNSKNYLLQLRFTQHGHGITLAMLWAIINLALFLQKGIVTGYEAEKYITNADHLLQTGHLANGQFRYYYTEILLISIAKQTGTFPYLPVLVQLSLNAFATLCFYRLLYQSHRNWIAAAGTAALIAMVYYQEYNFYLFTESIYFSGLIIYLHGLQQAVCRQRLWIALLPLMLVLMIFTRPVGIFLVPATVAFLLLQPNTHILKIWKWLCCSIAIAAFTLMVNTIMNAGGGFNFLMPFSSGQILCGVSNTAPAFILPNNINPNSLQGIGHMIVQQPRFFIQIAVERFLSFWGLIRSFYAPAHNLFIAVYFYSLYLLSVLGIRRWCSSDHSLLGFIVTLLLLTSFAATLSCDDWHNRFILPLLPMIIILASFVARPFAQK